MSGEKDPIAEKPLEPLILLVRDQRVILDAVKRNNDRFPLDFAFQLSAAEAARLKSQSVISNRITLSNQGSAMNRSQTVTGSRGGTRKRPRVFTEHGALMAANVLRSSRATHMSIFVIRAFVRLREQIAANAAILKRLAQIDRTLLQHDVALRDVYRKLQPLLAPPAQAAKRRIGF